MHLLLLLVNSIFLGSLFSLLIFWLIFLPKEPKFFVTNSTLTQFDFTNATNTLHYNLALNITIRNPNRRVGFYYNCIEAIANYRLKRFALVTLTSTPIYQGHKNTTVLKQVFLEGQGEVVFGQNDISNFNSETAAGVYNIDIHLAVKVSDKFGKLKTSYYTPSRKINCKLKVPLNVNETSAGGFNITKCGNVKIFSDPDTSG
ncbi:NDR1/HIN1-like protein 10 [Pyrus communis]|uniref:NDR1/HIN1-like protein 10 n=1 Tax=Pyrus communis TaxID=23211 RepID=UPI0035C0DDDB